MKRDADSSSDSEFGVVRGNNSAQYYKALRERKGAAAAAGSMQGFKRSVEKDVDSQLYLTG
jgi:hypothetical protein